VLCAAPAALLLPGPPLPAWPVALPLLPALLAEVKLLLPTPAASF
jgi:hypothetical protein